MATPVLKPYRAYRDRHVAAGDAPIDLFAKMVPSGMGTPTACSITWTTGTAGHWDRTGGSVAASSAGDTANLSDGEYVATVTMTWSTFAAPNDVASGELRIICPPTSVYVDPVTGSDAGAGSKAAPWQHSPDDVNVTPGSTAANYTASGLTLCVHKNGSLIRSGYVAGDTNLINAAGVGWGTGDVAEITGADLLPAHTAPSSGEVFANPRLATIRKFTLSTPFTKGRFLIDRDLADGLIQWAQWPAVGSDPYKYAADPFVNATRGMYIVPVNSYVVAGAASTWTCPASLHAAWDAEFGSNSVVGAVLILPGSGNFLSRKLITNHNIGARQVTFDIGSSYDTVSGQVYENGTTGASAVQIVGHPASIKAADQFAWKADAFASATPVIYGDFSSGAAPEIMTRHTGMDASGVSSGAIYGFKMSGFVGAGVNDKQGSGVAVDRVGGTWRYDVLDITGEFFTCVDGGKSALVRFSNTGLATGCIVQGNDLQHSVGVGLVRATSSGNNGCHFYGNSSDRCTVTTFYVANANLTTIVEHNVATGGSGPHANIYSFYENPYLTFRYNYGEGCRPLTVSNAAIVSHDNMLIMDDLAQGAAIYGGSGHSFARDTWLRAPGVASTAKALSAGGSAVISTFTACIIDGLTGGAGATFTGCLLTNRATAGEAIDANVAPDSGNTYVPNLWTGTLLPSWKAILGTGPHGRDYLYGISYLTITNQVDIALSTVVSHGWVQVTTDGTKTLTPQAGLEYRTNTVTGDAGASAWTSTPGSVTNGLWLNFRLTSSASNLGAVAKTIDFGEGNVFTWTVTTARANAWPGVNIDSTTPDEWRLSTSSALGSNSKFATIALVFKPTSWVNTTTFFGHSTGNTTFRAELLNTRKIKFQFKNAANATIISTFESSTAFAAPGGAPFEIAVAMTVDMNQTTFANAVKVYVDVGAGWVAHATTTPTTFDSTGLENIGWSIANNLFRIGGAAIDGVLAMAYAHNAWIDLTDAAVRDKISALRMGGASDGSSLTGTQPLVFLVGDEAYWDAAGAGAVNNRGTAADFTKQGSTDVTPATGYGTTWPPYTYATAVADLAGPAGVVGVAREYSVDFNGALANPATVTLSDGGAGGTFTPASLVFDPAAEPVAQTFDYEPAATGTVTITAAATGFTSDTLAIVVSAPQATSYTFAADDLTVNVGDPVELTIVLNGGNDDGTAFGFSLAGGSGVFDENPAVLVAGLTTLSLTFVPSTAGTITITPDNTEGLTDPAAIDIVVSAPAGGVVATARPRLALRLGLGL